MPVVRAPGRERSGAIVKTCGSRSFMRLMVGRDRRGVQRVSRLRSGRQRGRGPRHGVRGRPNPSGKGSVSGALIALPRQLLKQ